MSILGKIFKSLNPLKLATDFVGGWLGNVLRIASTIVTGIATGRKFGEIMKDVVKEVAVLAVKLAITAFTGGTAGLFINTLIDKAQGVLGKIAGKILESTLARPVASWVSSKLTGFASSLTTDLVRKEITHLVLDVTGLNSASEQLDRSKLDAAALERRLGELFQKNVRRAYSPLDLAQTQTSLELAADEFVAA